MDFSLTREQQRLRSDVIAFARAELGAEAAAHDRDASFDHHGWKACARFGVLGWPIDPAYGGSGLDPLSAVVAFEALAYGCADNSLVFAVNNHLWACAVYIAEHGTAQQRSRFLPPLVDGSQIGAHALTEPEWGSDAMSIATTAIRDGDHYVLDGTKCFISNGPCADLFIVFASTNPSAPAAARLSAFIVPASTPGVTVLREIPKAGLRGTPMGEILFRNCRIPADQLLGAEGAGNRIFMSTMEYERGFMFAAQVGSLQRILDRCVRHAVERQQFGLPIGAFQAVSHRIADMRVRLELARLLLYKVGWLKREGRTAMLEAAMLKLFASESLVDSALDAMRLHGARGYVGDLPVEREVRDALGSTIYGGTSEIQRNIIAQLIGLPGQQARAVETPA
jgi:alkylation response protein AidB-like acyl-CoA dehydrogenase